MAKYIPDGWACSPQGASLYQQLSGRIEAIIARRVSRYPLLPGLSQEDLRQEARLAASYAVDTFETGRGKLDNYIGVCVENALAMVASESLAQCRQPYCQEWVGDSWTKVAVFPASIDVDLLPGPDGIPESQLINREQGLDQFMFQEQIRDQLRSPEMSPDAHQLLATILQHPVELQVMARNRRMPVHQTIRGYLGWPRKRLDLAKTELRQMAIQLLKERVQP